MEMVVGNISILTVDLDDQGVFARRRNKIAPPSSFNRASNPISTIFLDENNEYSLTEAMVSSVRRCELYDGDTKILEWLLTENNCLLIEAFTESQINLFADLDLYECHIIAKGPLFFGGKITAKSTLSISAQSLLLGEAISCEGEIDFQIKQGLGFLAPVTATNLIAHAAYIYQASNLNIKNSLDISTQVIKQEASAKIESTNFTLLTIQSQIDGELLVTENSFITATIAVFGSPNKQATLKMKGQNYFRFGNLLLQGDTQLLLGSKDSELVSMLLIDEQLVLKDQSIIDLYNTNAMIDYIDNEGEFVGYNSTININQFLNNGHLYTDRSTLNISKQIYLNENTSTHFDKSTINCPSIINLGGFFKVQTSEISGQSLTMHSGRLEIIEESICALSNALSLSKETSSLFKESDIIAKKLILLNGKAIIDHTILEAPLVRFNEQPSSICHSEIKASRQLDINHGAVLKESILEGAILNIRGDLVIDKIKVYALKFLMSSGTANVQYLSVSADELEIKGNKDPDQVIFKKSVFVTNRLSCVGYINMDHSWILGVDEKKVRHEFHTHLKLNHTKFFTESEVHLDEKSALILKKSSQLNIGLFRSHGAMKVKDSDVVTKEIQQLNGKIKAKSSTIKIQDKFSSSTSRVKLSRGSNLVAQEIILKKQDKLKLKGASRLIATEMLISGPSSSISSKSSILLAKKFNALGRTELTQSILSADELNIYNRFKINDKTQLSVAKLLAISRKGNLKATSSLIHTNELFSSGRQFNSDSLISVTKKASLAKGSVTTMEGSAELSANKLVLSGKLQIQEKPGSENDSEKSSHPQIKASDRFMITSDGRINATANLDIEASESINFGKVNSTKRLKKTGGVEYNYNLVAADNLFLGFDNFVVNDGTYSTNNMVVHSNMINMLGTISAKQSYSCAGFYGLNLGLIAANNYSNSSLLSANFGLVLPNFSADLNYIFSAGNLLSAAQKVATTLLPSYAHLINMGFAVPGLIRSSYNLYDNYFRHGFKRFENMRRHEWMPFVCQLKSVASSAMGICSGAKESLHEFTTIGTDMAKLFDINTYKSNPFSHVNWIDLGTDVASVFAGSYSDTSLIHINAGLTLAASSNETNLFSLNVGAHASLFSHHVDSKLFVNTGYSGGGKASFESAAIVNAGELQGLQRFNLKADKMLNGTTAGIDGNNTHVEIAQLTQHGHMSLHKGQAMIETFTDDINATTEFSDIQVTGDTLHTDGHMKAEHVLFKYETAFKASDKSHFETDEVTIYTKEFEDAGTLSYENTLYIKADKATLKEGSVVQGERTDEDKLFVLKETPAEQTIDSTTDGVSNSDIIQDVIENANGNENNDLPGSDNTDSPTVNNSGGKTVAKNIIQTITDYSVGVAVGNSVETNGSSPETAISESTKPAIEQIPSQDSDGNAEQTKEPEKIFKPQHILILESNKLVLDGKLSGGDYTEIHGKATDLVDEIGEKKPTKCKLIEIGRQADIDLQYGSILSENAIIDGRAHLRKFDVKIDATTLSDDGKFELEESGFKGVKFDSNGHTVMVGVSAHIDMLNLSENASESLKDTVIESTIVKDDSHLEYQGQVSVITDHYEHKGNVIKAPPSGLPTDGAEDKNMFYLKSKTANLHGQADMDNAFFSIDSFNDGIELVTGVGQYSDYKISDGLFFETQSSFHLSKEIERDCDLTIKAFDITIKSKYNKGHDLAFISTVGDVALLSDINAHNLYAKSAQNIWTNHNLNASSTIGFEATKGCYNLGGNLNSDNVSIKASEIKNISAGSSAANQNWGIAMGSGGIINGRTNTFLESTQGNIENDGGIIRGGKYTQLISTGNVVNNCNVRSHAGAYDILEEYDAGLIAGGDGTETGGIGLYIKADGKVISDASDFVSNGVNYIEADKGFDLSARQHTYISDRSTSRKWYGKKETHTTTSTNVKGSVIHSGAGVNILKTEHGGVNSVATRFSSPGGTEILARDDVLLFSIKSQDREYSSKSTLWGLSSRKKEELHQNSTPTLFLDNGVTRITSMEGTVDARGAYFIGDGDLSIKAKKRIKFGVDILNHEIKEKSRSFGASIPGLGAWQAYKDGGIMAAATAEDATLAKLNNMLHSDNAAEWIANSANLGINLYNTTNAAMRGLANGNLTGELMSRYGLGGAGGFSPSLTLSMTETSKTTKYQTQGVGGVDRGGNVTLEAGEGVDLENGVRVHAGGDMDVNAPEIIATAAALNSSIVEKSATQTISLSLITGQIQDASLSYSGSKNTATNYVNAELSASGNMKLHNQDGAIHKVELDGGNIIAQTLDADIDKLIITDKQDRMTTSTESVSASMSGQVSVYKGEGSAQITTRHSGLQIGDGINTNGHSVHVTEATMHGGAILSGGENHIQIDKLVAETLTDEQHYTGLGISFNINDLNRLHGQQATNQIGEQTIAVAEFRVDHIDYKANQVPVLYGEKGTHLEIGELQGEIHTSSSDGKEVIRDRELHLEVDIPLTNADYITNSRENIQGGIDKIKEFFHSKPKPEDQIPDHKPKVLPSKRKDEDIDGEKDVADQPDEINDLDIGISTEEQAAFMREIMQNLQFESIEEAEKFAQQQKRLQDEYNKTGQINEDIEKQLAERLKLAIIQTIKAGGEDGWYRFTKSLGPEYNKKLLAILSKPDGLSHIGVKTYFSGKSLLINVGFNLSLAFFDSSIDRKELARGTATLITSDLIFNITLKFVARGLAGPLGWGFVVLGVMDTLFYSQEFVDKQVEQGLNHLNNSQKYQREGSYYYAQGERNMAELQMGSAVRSEGLHIVSNSFNWLAECLWKKAETPKVKALPSLPISNATNKNAFFSSASDSKICSSTRTQDNTISTPLPKPFL